MWEALSKRQTNSKNSYTDTRDNTCNVTGGNAPEHGDGRCMPMRATEQGCPWGVLERPRGWSGGVLAGRVHREGTGHAVSKEKLFASVTHGGRAVCTERGAGDAGLAARGGRWAGLERAHPSDLRRQPGRHKGTGGKGHRVPTPQGWTRSAGLGGTLSAGPRRLLCRDRCPRPGLRGLEPETSAPQRGCTRDQPQGLPSMPTGAHVLVTVYWGHDGTNWTIRGPRPPGAGLPPLRLGLPPAPNVLR